MPESTRASPASPSTRVGRADLAMMALGLVANGFLALAARPLLSAEFLPPGAGAPGTAQAVVMLMAVALLTAAALLTWRGTAWGHAFTRVVTWSILVVGIVVALTFPRLVDRNIGAAIAAGCAMALVALGSGRPLPTRSPSRLPIPMPWALVIVIAVVVVAAQGPDLRGDWLHDHSFVPGMGGTRPVDGRDLRGIDLSNAALDDARFIDADLRGVDLHGAHGVARFDGARMGGADLHRATLAGSSMRHTSLVGADLRDADLRHTSFTDADLHHTDLRGADLRFASLEACNLRWADLRGADLRHARLPWSDAALGRPRALGPRHLSRRGRGKPPKGLHRPSMTSARRDYIAGMAHAPRLWAPGGASPSS